MSGYVLKQIIILANKKTREAKERLLIEESGRIVAALQGSVAGYAYLIESLAAEFHLKQAMLEDTGDDPLDYASISYELEEAIRTDKAALVAGEAWADVLTRIVEKTEFLKDSLLLRAEKSRNLDVSQGYHKAMLTYQNVFDAIDWEEKRREAKRQEDRKAMPLFHDVDEDAEVDE